MAIFTGITGFDSVPSQEISYRYNHVYIQVTRVLHITSSQLPEEAHGLCLVPEHTKTSGFHLTFLSYRL